MKILDNIFVVPGVSANSYILVDGDGLTIIDTGLPYSEKTVLRYIATFGWSTGDIKRILITHADIDHYGCLAALQKASGARTYASHLEAEAMSVGKSSRPIDRNGNNALQRILIAMFSRLMKATPFQVDEILAEGQMLPVLGDLQVVETRGHSPDHISFFIPSVHVLFCGDSMKSEEKGLRASRSRNNWDQDKAIAAVRKQAALGAQTVCPGHGPVVRDADGKFPV